jgi:hypothetical protein
MRNDQCTRIYKYRSLSGQYGREAIERALTRNELYWQSPAEFNDPFDCIPVLYFGDDAAERKGFHARAVARIYNGQPRAVRRRHRRRMDRAPTARMEERLRDAWGKWLSASAITCFSEVHDHPLMWGHYADSHKGVCLIFEEIANTQTQWFAFPVAYQESRPRVNLTRFNDVKVMMQALFLKNDHWAYEREQRMVAWKEAPGYRNFPAQLLKGIIFGAKIRKDDETFVRELLANRSDLRVFRAEIDDVEFKLNIVPA